MVRKHFETFAALERQMDAARQLRAEIVGGAICVACASVFRLIRRSLLRIAAQTPRGMSPDLHCSTGTKRR